MTTRISLNLSLDIFDAINAEAAVNGMTAAQFANDIITNHAIEGTHMNKSHQDWLKLNRSLCFEIAAMAKKIVQREGFSEDITGKAVLEAQKDVDWMDRYLKCIQSDQPLEKGNKLKADLNQNIGHHIKRALHAEVIKNEANSPQKGTLKNAFITQYSKLSR